MSKNISNIAQNAYKNNPNYPRRPYENIWVRYAQVGVRFLSRFRRKIRHDGKGRACAYRDASFILIFTVATLKRTTQPPVLGGISTRVSTLKFSTVSALTNTRRNFQNTRKNQKKNVFLSSEGFQILLPFFGSWRR